MVPGYCPHCKKKQFFSYTVGFSGTCPACKKFVINVYDKPVEEGQDTIA